MEPIVTVRDRIAAIVRDVADRHGVPPVDVMNIKSNRLRAVTAARHEAIRAVADAFPSTKTPKIARSLGFSHSAVLYGLGIHAGYCRTARKRGIMVDGNLSKEEFARIRARLGLSYEEMARALCLRDDGGRTVRRIETGGAAISGPVSRLMMAFDEGKLTP